MWKPVVGYEKYYVVDENGNVFSLRKNKMRKPIFNKGNGYNMMFLSGDTKEERKCFYVHKIVANAFIPNPDNLECVNHKNEVKTDNRAENLEWCSKWYNNTYNGKIEKCYKPIYQYSMDGQFIKEWKNAREIDKEGIANYKNISAVCRGKRKSAGGYIWRFKERSINNG